MSDPVIKMVMSSELNGQVIVLQVEADWDLDWDMICNAARVEMRNKIMFARRLVP